MEEINIKWLLEHTSVKLKYDRPLFCAVKGCLIPLIVIHVLANCLNHQEAHKKQFLISTKQNFQRWPEIFFMSFFQDIVCVRSVSCELFLIRILVVRQFSHAQFIL